MDEQASNFFANPEVRDVLDDYADHCLEVISNDPVLEGLPDAAEFFQARGFSDFPTEKLRVERTTSAPDNKPLKPLCPDGYDGCLPKCKMIRGEWVCVWTCRCP